MENVGVYIRGAPKEARSKLKAIRSTIKKAAPKAIEKISYGMPYYGYKGRLAYFRLGKGYIGLYIPPTPAIDEIKEAKKYRSSISTFQFPLEMKLPTALIKKLIKARAEFNEGTENHVKSILRKLKNKRSVAR